MAALTSANASTTHAFNVLVVDDHKVNRSILKNKLERLSSVHVAEAHDGAQAVQAITNAGNSNKSFDIVFMDIEMPNMNGYEATAKIKEKYPNAIIIACTTLSKEEVLTASSGFHGYLAKPCNEQQLRSCISEVIPSALYAVPKSIRTAEALSSAVPSRMEEKGLYLKTRVVANLITAACVNVGFFAAKTPVKPVSHPVSCLIENIQMQHTPSSTRILAH